MRRDEFLDVFNLDALGFAGAHKIADGGFSGLNCERRAGQCDMCQQAVHRTIQITTIGLNRTCNKCDHRSRNFKSRL